MVYRLDIKLYLKTYNDWNIVVEIGVQKILFTKHKLQFYDTEGKVSDLEVVKAYDVILQTTGMRGYILWFTQKLFLVIPILTDITCMKPF